jgi:hypothetical protein
MFRVPLLSRESSLLLTPRWGGAISLSLALWLLAGLIPLLLIIWLYRHELRLVSRCTAGSLLILRFLVLGLVWALVCLQPMVAHSATEEVSGRVLFALDCSDSMEIADPQRPRVEKLRLARALHLAHDLCSDGELDDWIRLYEEKGGPLWDKPASQTRHQAHDEVCRRVDQLTRLQVAQRILSDDGLRLVQGVGAHHQVELLGFAHDVWGVEAGKLEQLLAPVTSEAGQPGDMAAKPHSSLVTSFTDLRLPLERALERSGDDRGGLLGVILLTDGQHNWGNSPEPRALELGERGVPIYPIALGARQAPPDIAVTAVKAPASVFQGVEVPVEARIKVSGLPAQDLVVELQVPGQLPVEVHIQHDGSDRYHSVHFQARLDKVGSQALTVSARSVPGEIRSDNNNRPVVIHVADDQAKVLLIEGDARWEYHYLVNALARDRTVQVSSVVFTQPRLGKVSEEDLERAGNPRLTMPTDPDALARYDCIVLGDVSPEQLSLAERRRLEKYVADRGGTLVVLAGKRFMPLAFAAEREPLRSLLPLEEPQTVHPEKGFALTLTSEGKLTPFLQMEPTPAENESRWTRFPHHYWGVTGRAKPAATALAFIQPEEGGPGKRDSSALEKTNSLLLRQNYGFGRVLFIGLESTWRWRFKTGDTYHHRFWGQVVRWATADKPLVVGNDHVRFGTRDAVHRSGQEVDLVVRLGESVAGLRPNALAGARIFREIRASQDELVAILPLSRRDAQPQVLEGRIRDLPPARYGVELAIPDLGDKVLGPLRADGKPGRLRAPFTVSPPEGEEMNELATNWPLLEELAAKSGGRVFTPENVTELAELLTRQALGHEQYTEQRLWQWWMTLVFLLVLLTVEWVARKWAGLP